MDRIRALIGIALVLACLSATADSSSLTWAWRNPLPNSDAFKVIAFGGGTYVAAGQDGVIYSSTDGVTWLPATNAAIGMGGQYLDAIYAGGKFVLAGVDAAGGAHVSSSSDGKLWIDTRLSFDTLYSYLHSLQLGFGNGTYLVMGPGGEATSHDAATWTEHGIQVPGTSPFSPIVFANGLFVKDGEAVPVVTTNETVYFSSDGANWTQAATALNGFLATDGTTFFSFAFSDVYTSTDGNHWTKHAMTGDIPSTAEQVLWDGTQFRAMASAGAFAVEPDEETSYSSPDGITWTRLSSIQSSVRPVAGLHSSVATGAGYLAVGSGALNIQQSTDFSHWSSAYSGSNGPDPDLAKVIYAGGRFVAVGETPQHGPAIMQSQDGSHWTQPLSGSASGGLTSVAYGNGLYVAAGTAGWFSSPDASNWTALTAPPRPPLAPLMYGNGRFLAITAPCSSTSCTSATSTDGKTWKEHPVTAPHSAVTFDGTRFVSLGNSPSGTSAAPVYTSCDGVDWTHSANIDVAGGSTFSSLRQVANGLVATGDLACRSNNPHGCLGPDQVAIATGPDSSHLTAVSSNLTTDSPPTDVIFAGGLYYAAAHGAIYISSDGSNWTDPVGTPVDANSSAFVNNVQLITAFATDGTQLIAVGNSGSIVGATVSTSPLSSGGACKALPEVSNAGGSGSFGFFALTGLLGLLLSRRRIQQSRI